MVSPFRSANFSHHMMHTLSSYRKSRITPSKAKDHSFLEKMEEEVGPLSCRNQQTSQPSNIFQTLEKGMMMNQSVRISQTNLIKKNSQQQAKSSLSFVEKSSSKPY